MSELRQREIVSDAVLLARLLDKMTPEPNSGCWLWMGAGKATGYGHMWNGHGLEIAHRLSYRLQKGPIPAGMVVCHRCDVPSCINPDHLWLGSQAANLADMASKGRRREGSHSGLANGRAILTPEAVAAIRAAPKGYGTGRVLAKRYGVSDTTIASVRAGHTWGQSR